MTNSYAQYKCINLSTAKVCCKITYFNSINDHVALCLNVYQLVDKCDVQNLRPPPPANAVNKIE